MEKTSPTQSKWFIIEHMEEWLFEWCTCEYIQATNYLSKRNNKLLVSNFAQVVNNKSEENLKNLSLLFTTLANQKLTKSIYFMMEQIKTAMNPETFIIKNLHSISTETFKVNENPLNSLTQENTKVSFPLSTVSLLDLRAKKALCHDDRKILNVLIFGGILGDHPPRDRTRPLRDFLGDNMRHLGRMQMSTDTAVFTSQIILSDGIELEAIPFVDAPEVVSPDDPDHAIDLEGFRYVSKRYSLEEGVDKKGGSKEVYMHPKIRNELLFEEFDFGNMDLA